MSFQQVLETARSGGGDLDIYDELARTALDEGEEEAALACLVPAAERIRAGLLWQWAGLLHRSLDEHEAALRCFDRASSLAPRDVSIAHGHAQVALEAGVEAVELFLRARSLAPTNGDVALGLAAARNAVGQGMLAAEELSALVARAPAWIAGHEQLAQLLSTLGCKDRATDSLEQAIAQFPTQETLWSALFAILIGQEDYAALEEYVARAEQADMRSEALDLYRAIAAAELSSILYPEALFKVRPELDDQLGLWRIRHLLRRGAVRETFPLIDKELASERRAAAWPYASIAWHLANDSRSEWLEGDEQLVQVFDVRSELPAVEELGRTLRQLHVAKGEYIDQSVRGGTQTDGPLLSRIDPVVRQLRTAIVGAIRRYLRQLPPFVSDHPLLSQTRERRIRFSGSWSVRLRPGGRHANHVHPQGWISSALYVELPPHGPGERDDSGWFTLGQPQEELCMNVKPKRKIEPRVGQLVLFPSWMWHGTVPFATGERLTVAFDVRPPI